MRRPGRRRASIWPRPGSPPLLLPAAAIDLTPSPLAGRFSARPAAALEVARFSGPAVQPLGVVRTADAGL
jgi:hypothetical protein